MPIFRVKSVKIYTGQKNLHWRRRPRRRQLSGMYLDIQPQCWIWKQQVCPLLGDCIVFNISATTWIVTKVQSDIVEISKKQISNTFLLDIGIRKEPRVTIVEWQLPTRSPTWRLMLVSRSVWSLPPVFPQFFILFLFISYFPTPSWSLSIDKNMLSW